MNPVLIGVDVGTTWVKATVFDADRTELGTAGKATPWVVTGQHIEANPTALAQWPGWASRVWLRPVSSSTMTTSRDRLRYRHPREPQRSRDRQVPLQGILLRLATLVALSFTTGSST